MRASSASNLALLEHRRRALAFAKIRSTTVVGDRQPPLLQPEHDVRLAGHRPDLDLLLAADQARRDAGIDGVDERAIALPERLDDRGGVHAGGRPERVAARRPDSSAGLARRSPRDTVSQYSTSAVRSRSM